MNESSTYIVEPRGDFKGCLIVIHEVWGLTDHIKDVANRFGQEGFKVVAPNLLSHLDIERLATPQLQHDLFNPDPAVRSTAQPKMRQIFTPLQSPEFADNAINKLREIFEDLFDDPLVKKNIAVVGYCFGGTYSYNLAMHEPRLKAAVPYYGHAEGHTIDELKNIKCPVLAFYGENDESLVNALPMLTTKMHEAGVDFTSKVYTGCGHAFFNDTNPYTYNADASADAWTLTLKFLEESFAEKI